MSTPRIDALDKQAVKLSYINAPNTDIQNRAQVVDLANDLRAATANDRFPMHVIYDRSNEQGPNGEKVHGLVNDLMGQVRFVGSWFNAISTYGYRPQSSIVNDYIEIIFYGTGLNMLSADPLSSRDVRVSIDGGAESANIMKTASDIIGGRGYSANIVVPVVSGLSLGIHSAKLRINAAQSTGFSGFEVLNENEQLRINAGSFQNGRSVAAHTSLFTGSFSVEEGSDAGAGASILIYEQNKVIKKAIRWADGNQQNLGSSDHTNERILATNRFREMGVGRSDDFSSLGTSNSDRLFTLEDGTTTMTGNDVGMFGATTTQPEGVAANTSGGFITFTFVGTGFDFIETRVNASGTSDPNDILVDGITVGSGVTISNIEAKDYKVVSGLPYGTHTVKLLRNAVAVRAWIIGGVRVYGPKRPTLPAGANLIHEHFLMGDFVANTTAGIDRISTGTLRKVCGREMTYVEGTGGTSDWAVVTDIPQTVSGILVTGNRGNAYYEHTFMGTGFDLRTRLQPSLSSNVRVTLNGTLLTTGNFPTASFSTYPTGRFNTATGILTFVDAGNIFGAGFVTSGLPFGKYTLRVENLSAGADINLDTLDIITPIHSPKKPLLATHQNMARIGSQSVGDRREFSADIIRGSNLAVANAVFSGLSTSVTSEPVPLPDMTTLIETEGGDLDIEFEAQLLASGGNNINHLLIFLDGRQVGEMVSQNPNVGGSRQGISLHRRIPVAPGEHLVQGYWYTGSGSITVDGPGAGNRLLSVREVKE